MSARKRKATRQARYRAGPLAPWRTADSITNWNRMLHNRGRFKPSPPELGCFESFRFIMSPTLE